MGEMLLPVFVLLCILCFLLVSRSFGLVRGVLASFCWMSFGPLGRSCV